MRTRTSTQVTVNGVNILVADLRAFSGALPDRWAVLPNSNWVYHVYDMWDLLKATKHNVSKIDAAVPQSWWDEQFKKTGKAPRACWSYEYNKLFGEPLYWDTVIHDFERELHKVWLASDPEV